MNSAKILWSILILLSTMHFSNSAFAFSSSSEKIVFDDIFEDVVDEKYYVKDGLVHVSPVGIFLCIKNIMIPITSVEADSEGVFLRMGSENGPRCSVCKMPLVSGTCLNPNCPASPFYEEE